MRGVIPLQEFILQHIVELFLSTVVTGLGVVCKILWKKLKEKEKDDDAQRDGLLSVLQFILYREAMSYIDAGCICMEDLKHIEYIYKYYHALGGNGTGTALYHRILKLPIEGKDGDSND